MVALSTRTYTHTVAQVVGGFHPALQPYYQLLTDCLLKSGDEPAADALRKTYLRQSVHYKALESGGQRLGGASGRGGRGGGGAAGRRGKK